MSRLLNASDIKNATGFVSLFRFMTEAQIAAVMGRTFSVDLTAAIQAAFDSGEALIAPAGGYLLDGPVYTPNTAAFRLQGFGKKTEFRPAQAMPFMIRKRDRADGATIEPVDITDLYFDCNRLADSAMWIGIGKKGRIGNIIIDDMLVHAIKLGDDEDTQVSAFYENLISHIVIDGGAEYAGSAGTMPDYGLVGTKNATDNLIQHIQVGYVSEAAAMLAGGFNTASKVHGYGLNSADTGPKYCVHAKAAMNIIDIEADNVTVAGVKVSANNVQVTAGSYYWASDNTPSVGGAVPIEVDELSAVDGAGISSVQVNAGQIRGGNAANPAVRWLGPNRPSSLVVIPMTGTYAPQAGDEHNSIRGNLLQRGFTGVDAKHRIQAQSNTVRASVTYDANGTEFHREGTDGTSVSDWTKDYWNGSAWVEVARLKRATGAFTFNGSSVRKRRARYAGQWFNPVPGSSVQTGSAATGADSLRLVPFYLDQAVALSNLGLRVTTTGSGNFLLAIYADDGAGKPTGSPLAVAAAGATSSAAAIVVNLSSSLNLEPGAYWVAFLSSDATAVFQCYASGNAQMAHEAGALTLGGVSTGASTSFAGYSMASSYAGGMPDLTGASLTAVSASTTPVMYLRVAP